MHAHTQNTQSRTQNYTHAGALWQQEGSGGGRIAVLGSVQLFDDKYIDKEENSKLVDFIFKWLRPVRAGAAGGVFPGLLFLWCAPRKHKGGGPGSLLPPRPSLRHEWDERCRPAWSMCAGGR